MTGSGGIAMTHDRSDHLRGVLAFLRFLTSFPSPQDVTTALAAGPLAQYGPIGLQLFRRDSRDELVSIAHDGVAESVLARYGRVSLKTDIPLTRACRDGEIVIAEAADMLEAWPTLAIDQEMWSDITDQIGNGRAFVVPILARGQAIGLFTFFVADSEGWEPVDVGYLERLSLIMGLWLSNPETHGHASLTTPPTSQDAPLVLTERQQQVLRLVARGKSNDSIAATLGFSRSTVKQEIQRIMRALRVVDRQAAVLRSRELGLLDADAPRPAGPR